MRIDVITIFPDYLAPLSLSLVGKAIEAGIVDLAVHDLRWWTHDRHHTTDDTPYGGGAGMVMKPEPWGEAMDAMEHLNPAPMTVVVPTPTGRVLEYPNYTKPPVWRGRQVPPVLLSGNHAAIATWRREQALERTRQRRPDLFQNGS